MVNLKYRIASYYLVTLLISWGGLTLLVGGFSEISSQGTDVPFVPLYFVTVAGPFIAGLLLTGVYDGWRGYREFFSRLVKWRVSFRWYAMSLFIAPLTVFASLFILSLFSSVYIPGIFHQGNNPVSTMFGLPGDDKIKLSLFVLMLGLFNGLVEETGWTGFVMPRLNLKSSLIAGVLPLGIMWGLWHFLSNYIGSANGAGRLPLPLYLTITLFSFLPPFRILMAWVYDNTGSLLIAILMHASLDVFWILSMPVILSGKQRVIWYIMWAAILWSSVIIIKNSRTKKSIEQA